MVGSGPTEPSETSPQSHGSGRCASIQPPLLTSDSCSAPGLEDKPEEVPDPKEEEDENEDFTKKDDLTYTDDLRSENYHPSLDR